MSCGCSEQVKKWKQDIENIRALAVKLSKLEEKSCIIYELEDRYEFNTKENWDKEGKKGKIIEFIPYHRKFE